MEGPKASLQMRTLAVPCLMLVTDRRLCDDAPLLDKVAGAVAGGITAIQIREKDLSARDLLDLAQRLRLIIGDKALLIINDRLDVALACKADGVHLPENGLPASVARQIGGRELLIGRSVHSVAGAVAAKREGADYIELGTIFITSSKPEAQPVGPSIITATARRVSLPILAIGGVNASNIAGVIRGGASGAALISAILAAPDPQRATEKLMSALKAAWADRVMA